VVGDVDPAAVETKIRSRFSDWRGAGEAGADPDLGRVAQRSFEAGSFVQQGALREVAVSWLRPYIHVPDSLAKRQEDWRKRLTLAVPNRRLLLLADGTMLPSRSRAPSTAISTDPCSGRGCASSRSRANMPKRRR
jgi:zinc protease